MSYVVVIAFVIFLVCFLKFARPKIISLLDDSIEKIRREVVNSQRNLKESSAKLNGALDFRAKLDSQKAAISRDENERISELLSKKEVEKLRRIDDLKKLYAENRKKEIEELNKMCKLHFSNAIVKAVVRIAKIEKIDQKKMLAIYVDLANDILGKS